MAGVDEVGRGCLAGPVVAACIVYPLDNNFPRVFDSKILSPNRREALFEEILRHALACAVAAVSAAEIDAINIHRASLKAMQLAVEQIVPAPDYLLIDGRHTLPVLVPQEAVIRGDAKCQSIAAASIVAKVWRDRLMDEAGQHYPGFSFGQHKGYGTLQHRAELVRYGPTTLHRTSFRGVSNS